MIFDFAVCPISMPYPQSNKPSAITKQLFYLAAITKPSTNSHMRLQDKYRSVLNMGEKFNTTDGYVEEADGHLRLGGTVEYLHQKDQMWDEIKRIGGENATDIMADIKVTNHSIYARHTVEKGESLSLIAKEYLNDVMAYKAIFAANSDTLEDPNKIFPGQELVIPFPEGRTA
jgi:LysM repeat protein